MTSELEKMASEYGNNNSGFYPIEHSLKDAFLAGAKAVLEFARANWETQARGSWDTGEILVNLKDLEKFIEGEK